LYSVSKTKYISVLANQKFAQKITDANADDSSQPVHRMRLATPQGDLTDKISNNAETSSTYVNGDRG